MPDFISESELLTFEGWLKYRAVDAGALMPEHLAMWRDLFDETMKRRETSRKVGRIMPLRSAKAMTQRPGRRHNPII
jgi:hypothetical protein